MNVKFEKWANTELKRLHNLLLLNAYHLNEIQYKSKATYYLECAFAYPYKTIQIYYGSQVLEDWKKKDFKTLLNGLTHEMCHPITDPIYNIACERYATKLTINDERERLTDTIANIILTLI